MPITFKSSSKRDVAEDNASTLTKEEVNGTCKQIFSNTDIYKQTAGGEIISSSVKSKGSELYVYKATSGSATPQADIDNSFIGTVLRAYDNHNNLILRPDDIWLAIMTQFATYVESESVLLRDLFVIYDDEELKLEIAGGGNRFNANYSILVDVLTNKCKNFLRKEIKDWIIPSFTTTTYVDKTAGTMVMMSCLQKYHTYKIHLRCGIPNITLLGEPSDWEEIRRRIERLSDYDIGMRRLKLEGVNNNMMTDWKNLLILILDEFVFASKGSINVPFWDDIVKYIPESSFLTGWITAFMCFGPKGQWLGGKTKGKNDKITIPKIDANNINIGFRAIPFELVDNGTEYEANGVRAAQSPTVYKTTGSCAAQSPTVYKAMFYSGHMFHDVISSDTIQPRIDWIVSLVDEEQVRKARVAENNKNGKW